MSDIKPDNKATTQTIPTTTQTIEALQQSYSNIKIYTAVPMGVVLILYFFTFATLIDKGMQGILAFEIITSILFVFFFIFMNRAAFFLLKIRYKNKPPFSQALLLMEFSDLAMKPEALSSAIDSRR